MSRAVDGGAGPWLLVYSRCARSGESCDDAGMGLLPALDGVHGDSTVTVDGGTATWSRLAARADALGTEIAGAPAIAVHGTATLDTVIAVVAGLRAGVPVVPVPADAGPVEREHLLNDSGASLVIGDPDWPDIALPRVPIPAGGPETGAAPELDDALPALIMYTSGTTGLPKGAVIPRRAIAAGLDGLADAWGWTPDDHLVHGLPLFHVHGLILGVLGALRAGSQLTHTGRPFPDRYAAAGGTMYFGVPTVWSRLVDSPDDARALAGARLLVSGSAALPVPVFERLRELTGHVPVERYGMTETLITLSTRHDGERRPGWVGLPIAGVETRLRDDDGNEVVHDGVTIGGLQVRGETLFDGYLNLPEKTAESMTDDGWFVTGDSVSIDADGIRASLDELAEMVGRGELSMSEWKAAREPLQARLRTAEAAAARSGESAALRAVVGRIPHPTRDFLHINMNVNNVNRERSSPAGRS